MGDGHYDYRNIGTAVKNYIPAYQNFLDEDILDDEAKAFSTPDFFVSVSEETLGVNLAIGRFPVNSAEEADIMVEKVIAYETNRVNGLWQSRAILCADDKRNDDDTDGSWYVNSSEDLIGEVFPGFIERKRMYSPAYPTDNIDGKERRKPTLEAALLSEINTKGAAIVNYVGHGNPRIWSHEEWMERDRTVPKMINYNNLFFSFAATCDYGRFDNPEQLAGSEVMVLSEVGGAIGVVAASRASRNTPNMTLSKSFYTYLFQIDPTTGDYTTMGEALYKAKTGFASGNTKKFNLLGDPAVSLAIPKHTAKFTAINGIDADDQDTIINIKALERVTVSGNIEDVQGNVLSDFNGTGFLTIFDGDEPVSITDDIGDTFHWTEYGGTLNKSPFVVKNGYFETEVIIPKDISYSENTGRIFIFAYDDSTQITAAGIYENIIINGIETSAPIDENGPEITICLDYNEFTEGDFVSNNPKLMVELFDESGINTTGMGIGHKIEAWVDESSNPIDLTNYYNATIDDYRKGNIETILSNLSSGVHSIKLRAWDIYNNFSTETTYFRIKGENEAAEINNIYTYPNPTTGPLAFAFTHSAEPPYTVTIKVYNEIGMQVMEVSKILTTLRNAEIEWDGLNDSANTLAQGVYYYLIQIDENGKISHSNGNFIIQR